MIMKITDCRKTTISGVDAYLFFFDMEQSLAWTSHIVCVKLTELSDAPTLEEAKTKALVKLKVAFESKTLVESPTLSAALGHVGFAE